MIISRAKIEDMKMRSSLVDLIAVLVRNRKIDVAKEAGEVSMKLAHRIKNHDYKDEDEMYDYQSLCDEEYKKAFLSVLAELRKDGELVLGKQSEEVLDRNEELNRIADKAWAELFAKEIEKIPVSVRPMIQQLFSKFNQTIQSSGQRFERRQKLSFNELAKDMGYDIVS